MEHANFYMALGALAAVVAVGVTLLVHLANYAYQRGVSDQKIADLRERVEKLEHAIDDTTVKEIVAGLEASVEGFRDAIRELRDDLRASRGAAKGAA